MTHYPPSELVIPGASLPLGNLYLTFYHIFLPPYPPVAYGFWGTSDTRPLSC